MLTVAFFLYNIFKYNKSIPEWLNLEESRGLTTGLLLLILDTLISILISIIFNYNCG